MDVKIPETNRFPGYHFPSMLFTSPSRCYALERYPIPIHNAGTRKKEDRRLHPLLVQNSFDLIHGAVHGLHGLVKRLGTDHVHTGVL